MPGDPNLGHSGPLVSQNPPSGKHSRRMGNRSRERSPGSGPEALETEGSEPGQALLDAPPDPDYHSRLPSVGR
jgi:hypothetical protein